MQEKKQGFQDENVKGLMLILAYGQAACVTPFTRIDAGPSAMTIPIGAAAVLYWFWILGTHSEAIIGFALAWFVCVLFHRIQRVKKWLKGEEGHSWYVGYPIFTGWLVKDERYARGLEGLLMVAFGLVFEAPLHPVSHFVMASGASIIFIEALMGEADKKKRRAMRDAQIEAMWSVQQMEGR